jgi:hypothetical protein
MNRTKWHFWAIGIVALLWNLIGAFDYLMTQTRNESYMSQFTQEQLNFFYAIPPWAVATWAIGVWGGVLGTILLLLRKRIAIWAYLASVIGIVVTTFENYVLSNGMDVAGDAFSLTMTALILVIALALLWYARATDRQGILT